MPPRVVGATPTHASVHQFRSLRQLYFQIPGYVSEPIKVQLTLVQHRLMLPFSKGQASLIARISMIH